MKIVNLEITLIVLDYIPIVSTVSNLAHIILRTCFTFNPDTSDYGKYLQLRDMTGHCLRAIPFINIIAMRILGALRKASGLTDFSKADHQETVLAALHNSFRALPFASERLKRREEFWVAVVTQDGRTLKHVPKAIRTESFYNELVTQSEFNIVNIPESQRDRMFRTAFSFYQNRRNSKPYFNISEAQLNQSLLRAIPSFISTKRPPILPENHEIFHSIEGTQNASSLQHVPEMRKFVFCLPALGKPDPSKPRPSMGPDTRPRVVQLGQKNNTCWYYVFNILRNRYKASDTEPLRERQFEKITSSWRKAISNLDKSLLGLAHLQYLNQEDVKKALMFLTKETVSQFLGMRQIIAFDLRANEKKICSLMPQFLAQDICVNMYEYLIYLRTKQEGEISYSFFTKLSVDPKDLFETIGKQDPIMYEKIDWDDCPLKTKNFFIPHMIRLLSAERYGLALSSWHPSEPVESLIKELGEHGPLAIGGRFGRSVYVNAAKKMGRIIEGREVFGWTKSDSKKSESGVGHAILIVGAEKQRTHEYVYYIDPCDESDPLHVTKQPIYAMSYARLTSPSLCDNHGCCRLTAPKEVGYAFYRGAATAESSMDAVD